MDDKMKRVTLLMTHADYGLLQQLAEQQLRSVSAQVYHMIRQGLIEAGLRGADDE